MVVHHASRSTLACLMLMAACLLALPVAAFAQGEEYAGQKTCAGCHEDIANAFSATIHSKAGYWAQGFQDCESCHGPGAEHASSADPSKIKNPASLEPKEVEDICLGCHNSARHLNYWKGSIHQRRDLSCVDCHSVHSSKSQADLLKAGTQMDLCITCHTDIRMTLFQRSRHPMRDSTRSDFTGNMTCTDCHNPHGAVGDSLVDALSVNDKCYECHLDKKAPVLWEHAPVKENCLVCHSPHGSNHPNLLVKDIPRLCQTCHFQGRHQTVAGSGNFVWAQSRGCVNCHTAVHGSNHPSAVKLNK